MKEENHEHEEEQYYFNDSDMAVAHDQLMQLSDEDDQNTINNRKNIMINKVKEIADDNGEEVDQICCRITTTSTTSRRRPDWVIKVINEEIFGKDLDDEEVCNTDDQPRLVLDHKIKKRRYRSLSSIYRKTKPIDCDKDDDRHCQDGVLMRKKTLTGFIR